MHNCRAAGTATSQDGMKGSSAKMADARVDAYTKWVSNMRRVSQVNSAWKSASCTGAFMAETGAIEAMCTLPKAEALQLPGQSSVRIYC